MASPSFVPQQLASRPFALIPRAAACLKTEFVCAQPARPRRKRASRIVFSAEGKSGLDSVIGASWTSIPTLFSGSLTKVFAARAALASDRLKPAPLQKDLN